MAPNPQYHDSMRWLLNLSLVLLLAGVLQAQINGPRPSVTSLGGQFTIFNPPGPRASVTSLGPNGWGPGFCCFGTTPGSFQFHHHHHRGLGNPGVFFGGYPVVLTPYYYPADVIEPVDDSMEQSYTPGPTIFDRRASDQPDRTQQLDERLARIERQIDEAEQANPSHAAAQAEAPAPIREQPATVLVFRDGHTVEVKNYAIVGSTLYDYSNDTRRKIDLADLDVPATEKRNDDRGIDFRLPARSSGN